MKDAIDLGKRIAHWRGVRGLSQADLADLIGLTSGAVANWEVNTAVPTGKNLQRVVDALRVSMQQFWGPLPKVAKRRKVSR